MAKAATAEKNLEHASEPFVGRWLRLVSTSNWEKGRIIQEWRSALQRSGAPPTEFSDEAWCRRVSGVSGQHVGRLRRVFDRFGHVSEQYEGLFWSHFQAAIDWSDAEMWLEGAVRSRWSVSEMRRTRWETLGEVAGAEQTEEESAATELDEDFESTAGAPPEGALVPTLDEVQPIEGERQAGGKQDRSTGNVEKEAKPRRERDDADGDAEDRSKLSARSAAKPVRPFADLPSLPDDVAEAYEGLKLAILRHKAAEWSELSLDDLLAYLDALKELAVAPSGEEEPF